MGSAIGAAGPATGTPFSSTTPAPAPPVMVRQFAPPLAAKWSDSLHPQAPDWSDSLQIATGKNSIRPKQHEGKPLLRKHL